MCFLCSKPEVVQYFNNLIYEATTYHFIALSLNQSDYFESVKEDLATELEERISRNLELAAKECSFSTFIIKRMNDWTKKTMNG